MARGERGTEERGKLASAERGGDAQRIVEDRAMPGERAVDRIALAFEPARIDAGAVTGEARTAPAEQSRGDGGRGRRVADAHFAQDEEIGVRRDGVIA